VCLGVDHRMLFNPADLVFLRSNFQESPSVLEHFELLAIHHLGHAIRNRGDAIVQIHLPRGNINRLVHFLVQTVASRGEGKRAQQKPARSGTHAHRATNK
jgi:hypothetical protein